MMQYGLCVLLLLSINAFAAINLERTRLVFNEEDKSSSVGVSNNEPSAPYLVQSWIEDSNFKKLNLTAPIIVVPPLMRMEGGEKTFIRLVSSGKLSQLPADRESLFYLNVRGIPKAQKDSNVLQVAIQSTIKVIYRPAALKLKLGDFKGGDIKLRQSVNGITAENPTPYLISIVGLSGKKDDREQEGFKAVTLNPFSTTLVSNAINLKTAWVTFVNDFGGRIQLELKINPKPN